MPPANANNAIRRQKCYPATDNNAILSSTTALSQGWQRYPTDQPPLPLKFCCLALIEKEQMIVLVKITHVRQM